MSAGLDNVRCPHIHAETGTHDTVCICLKGAVDSRRQGLRHLCTRGEGGVAFALHRKSIHLPSTPFTAAKMIAHNFK